MPRFGKIAVIIFLAIFAFSNLFHLMTGILGASSHAPSAGFLLIFWRVARFFLSIAILVFCGQFLESGGRRFPWIE